jgi:hypothetical protein
MKKWELNHNGNEIRVENRNFSERLYVNGELQDERIGLAFVSRLWGKLPTGESVKVSIGGLWTMQCRIFIDHKLALSNK